MKQTLEQVINQAYNEVIHDANYKWCRIVEQHIAQAVRQWIAEQGYVTPTCPSCVGYKNAEQGETEVEKLEKEVKALRELLGTNKSCKLIWRSHDLELWVAQDKS